VAGKRIHRQPHLDSSHRVKLWAGTGDRVGDSRDKRATHPENMQLHIARLCLDCDEVHVAERCPVCGSDAFAYLARWIPAAERRMRTRPTSSPEADVYRRLIGPTSPPPQLGRLLRRSALGVTVVAVASWVWRWSEGRKRRHAAVRAAEQ